MHATTHQLGQALLALLRREVKLNAALEPGAFNRINGSVVGRVGFDAIGVGVQRPDGVDDEKVAVRRVVSSAAADSYRARVGTITRRRRTIEEVLFRFRELDLHCLEDGTPHPGFVLIDTPSTTSRARQTTWMTPESAGL
jgi:hypothetical protein